VRLVFLEGFVRFGLNGGVRAAPPCVQEKRGSKTFNQILPSHP
jgi:hypothetical protein